MRLNKYLARCGLGSRRKCDSFIDQGLIKINGKKVKDFSIKVSENDFVQFKNRVLNYVEENYLYIVNKPRGYVSTLHDTKGRKKVIDLIDSNIRLFNIGISSIPIQSSISKFITLSNPFKSYILLHLSNFKLGILPNPDTS